MGRRPPRPIPDFPEQPANADTEESAHPKDRRKPIRVLTAVVAALTLATSSLAQTDKRPPHWIPGKGDQGWQWRWDVWLPAKWFRVARCETGVNWSHANSQYVSAFGIYRPQYNADARSMGAPPWNDAKPPSPWHQYRAALGHYRMFGGFSGWGCRNA